MAYKELQFPASLEVTWFLGSGGLQVNFGNYIRKLDLHDIPTFISGERKGNA